MIQLYGYVSMTEASRQISYTRQHIHNFIHKGLFPNTVKIAGRNFIHTQDIQDYLIDRSILDRCTPS